MSQEEDVQPGFADPTPSEDVISSKVTENFGADIAQRFKGKGS